MLEQKTAPRPIVVYGTVDVGSLEYGQISLSFLNLILATQFIPMKDRAFVVEFDRSSTGWNDFHQERARNQGAKLFQLYSRLAGVEGLKRLWCMHTGLIVQGDPGHFDSISEKVRTELLEVFGDIEFHKGEHNDARPFFPLQ
jgi:hypothetical protein